MKTARTDSHSVYTEHMTEAQARDTITAIVGPVDRPWDTRFSLAWAWATHAERLELERAARALGYATPAKGSAL